MVTGRRSKVRNAAGPLCHPVPLSSTDRPSGAVAFLYTDVEGSSRRWGLREVLGERTYESLARKGAAMTTAAIVAYAYDQIDQARTQFEDLS
jgi:hypothetical protein